MGYIICPSGTSRPSPRAVGTMVYTEVLRRIGSTDWKDGHRVAMMYAALAICEDEPRLSYLLADLLSRATWPAIQSSVKLVLQRLAASVGCRTTKKSLLESKEFAALAADPNVTSRELAEVIAKENA